MIQVHKGKYIPGGKRLLTVQVSDGTGRMEIVFFNGKYMENAFVVGKEYLFYGKASYDYGKIKMTHPEFSAIEKSNDFTGILPIYPLTAGISQNDIRKWQREARHVSFSF